MKFGQKINFVWHITARIFDRLQNWFFKSSSYKREFFRIIRILIWITMKENTIAVSWNTHSTQILVFINNRLIVNKKKKKNMLCQNSKSINTYGTLIFDSKYEIPKHGTTESFFAHTYSRNCLRKIDSIRTWNSRSTHKRWKYWATRKRVPGLMSHFACSTESLDRVDTL